MPEQTPVGDGVGLAPGTKIGKYEVVRRMAIGGQAILYVCRDPLLDRTVAVKQISTQLAEDPKFIERFRAEARILARLGAEQPAIITVHDLIEDEKGLFIVMEHVEGPTLERVLADNAGPVEAKAVLQLLWRLASALYDVHTAGIVHRDLKPSNIIVTEGLHPKIVDFGVAASVTGQTSMKLGTTKYMAPELYAEGPVDGRADIYSLGFLTYEMLLGREKFNEIFQDVIRDRHSEALRWMKWHGNREVSAPAPHEVNESVPREMSHIVMKMIAKDPAERYESAEAVGRAVRMAFSPKAKAARQARKGAASTGGGGGLQLDDSGITDAVEDYAPRQREQESLREESPTAPIPRRSVPLWAKIAAAAVVVVGIVGAGVYVGFQEDPARTKATNAYRQAEGMMDEGRHADAAKAFEAVATGYPSDLGVVKRASVMAALARGRAAMARKDWTLAQEARKSAEERNRQVQAQTSEGSRLYDWTQKMNDQIDGFDESLTASWNFDDALKTARRLLGEGRFDEARLELENRYRKLGPMSSNFQEEFESFIDRADRQEFETGLTTRFADANALVSAGELARAQQAYDEIVEDLESSPKVRLLDGAKVQEYLSRAKRRSRTMSAQRAYEQALASAEQAKEAGDAAAELAALGKAIEALSGSEELESPPGLLSRRRNVQAAYHIDRAKAALADGQVDQAEAELIKALQVDGDNAVAKGMLDDMRLRADWTQTVAQADRARAAGEWAKAMELYDRAQKMRPDVSLEDRINQCGFELKLDQAQRLRQAGEYDKAQVAYEEAIRLRPSERARVEALMGEMNTEQKFGALVRAGRALLERKQWAKAKDAFDEAGALYAEPPEDAVAGRRDAMYGQNLQLGTEAMNDGDMTLARSYFRLAQKQKDTQEVRDLLEKVEQSE